MTRPARSASPSPDPLFAVAMLRIALELKKDPAPTLEALVAQVVARMNLDGEAFRRYLDENLGLLRTSVAKPQTAVATVSAGSARAPARSRRTQRG